MFINYLEFSETKGFITNLCVPQLNGITLTNQSVLRFIASMLDPSGIILSTLIYLQFFMQKVLTLSSQWDEIMPEKLVHNWYSLIIRHSPINNKIIFTDKIILHVKNVTIYGFCDANQDSYAIFSYAAVIYILTSTTQNPIVKNFVHSKTKVAPLRHILPIPKLELIACVLLSYSIGKVENLLKCYVEVNIVS